MQRWHSWQAGQVRWQPVWRGKVGRSGTNESAHSRVGGAAWGDWSVASLVS